MTVRRVLSSDIPAVVELRRAMWNELHPEAPADAIMLESTARYLREGLESGRVQGWIVVDDAPIGMALLVVQEHPPRPSGRELRGYVTAVFVDPAHRRRGHARALMLAVAEYAHQEGFRRIMLRTTDQARRLYASVGYRALETLARDFPSE